MLWVTCPNCGARPVDEFAYGGELARTPNDVTGEADRNVDLLWYFDNVDGRATERWFHDAGCRRWLTLQRDTHTDCPIEDP